MDPRGWVGVVMVWSIPRFSLPTLRTEERSQKFGNPPSTVTRRLPTWYPSAPPLAPSEPRRRPTEDRGSVDVQLV